jgi:hypothetical protein
MPPAAAPGRANRLCRNHGSGFGAAGTRAALGLLRPHRTSVSTQEEFMKRWKLDLRVLVIPLLAFATVATLVAGAEAGQKYKSKNRGKHARVASSTYRAPGGYTVRREVVRRSAPRSYVSFRYVQAPRVYPRYIGPAYGTYVMRRPVSGGWIAGPVGGGLSLSITLGNVLPMGAYYFDPYCGREFASLSSYHSHCSGRHAAQIRVMQRDRGWYDDHDHHGGYDDEYYEDDGYYDDGGYDDGDGYYEDYDRR